MTAVFTDFDSSMASRIVVDSDAGHVDVTFRSSGTTYRFNLQNADISDIMSVIASRSKGKLLHQLLDIRHGVQITDVVSNVAVPNVSEKKTSVTKTSVKPSRTSKPSVNTQVKNKIQVNRQKLATRV